MFTKGGYFQLIIVQNILGQGGRWPPGQQAIGAISSFQRGGDEGRWGINITIIYGAPPKAPNPNIGAVPPISQFCQLLGVCVQHNASAFLLFSSLSLQSCWKRLKTVRHLSTFLALTLMSSYANTTPYQVMLTRTTEVQDHSCPWRCNKS